MFEYVVCGGRDDVRGGCDQAQREWAEFALDHGSVERVRGLGVAGRGQDLRRAEHGPDETWAIASGMLVGHRGSEGVEGTGRVAVAHAQASQFPERQREVHVTCSGLGERNTFLEGFPRAR
ncbi:MAG TPA: hypothetical protein VEP49_11380, partial [Acidimicrobiia bacterium]|nr:hypothetical protein [Acidimicrobiia bacterium]